MTPENMAYNEMDLTSELPTQRWKWPKLTSFLGVLSLAVGGDIASHFLNLR